MHYIVASTHNNSSMVGDITWNSNQYQPPQLRMAAETLGHAEYDVYDVQQVRKVDRNCV